ncbi:outer membrane protein [Methylocystis parvus]|uniref:outer membrane protein n=1 Tax=Methylocystis parvus TaxID=134 RepID=UPI003C771E15
MKKLALSVAALAVSAGAALAADLPSRKGPPVLPPPPPPPPMWTGFYVGLNAGGTWANSTAITTAAAPFFANPALGGSEPSAFLAGLSANSVGNTNASGFIGGGQIGYNYQFYNSFVVGIEADIQGIAGSSNSSNTFGAAGDGTRSYFTFGQVRSNLDYLGTVRGRLGWLAMPTLLIYGTGGLAYGGVSLNSAYVSTRDPVAFTLVPFFGGAAFSDTRVGWTAGGGVEWMFMPNWSAKVEYLYYDLGTVSTNSAAVQLNGAGVPFVGYAAQTSHRYDGNIVRAGLNYHFNWGAPAPVVAKY